MPSASSLDVGDAPTGARSRRLRAASAARRREPRDTHRVPRSRRGTSASWLLVVLLAGAGGLGGSYLFEKWQVAADELRGQNRALAAAHARVAAAEERILGLEADLIREREARGDAETNLVGARRRADSVERRAEQAAELEKQLQEILGEQGTVTRDDADGRLTVEMVDKVLFPVGEAVLTERGEAVLHDVGEALKSFPDKQVWVQGHTDDLPINNEMFTSNWELSSARALTVVHYLQDVAGVDPQRLAAVGFGEYRPVSRRRRSRNRRIEIVLFPRDVRLVRE